MEDVDNSVSRILHIKYALGLFVDPYKFCNEEYESQTIMKKNFWMQHWTWLIIGYPAEE